MINSRSLDDLFPVVKDKATAFLAAAAAQHIDVIITSTYRDAEAQAALYAQGRSAPGNIVTNAKPGESYHNWKCAFDFVGLRFGRPVWDAADPMWGYLGELGESVGLEWAGRWKTFKEQAHFQYTGGLTLAQLQAGGTVA
jgi:peptidoglycan LD-endopeptidase CwlK